MPYAAKLPDLALFQRCLIGKWENKPIVPGAEGPDSGPGGKEDPYSYNIMPLPQSSAAGGYILKNFRYYETIVFQGLDATAIPAEAPNRGGTVSQHAFAIFYDQQVRFAKGVPDDFLDKVVHVENGAWLFPRRYEQENGSFVEKAPEEPDYKQQPSDLTVAKQIAVPHGNSVLALGSFDTRLTMVAGNLLKTPIISHAPVITDAPLPFPPPSAIDPNHNLDINPYITDSSYRDGNYNPNKGLVLHPNRPLQEAVAKINPGSYLHWRVTTLRNRHGKGHVTNIPFEQRASDVTEYWADYWLLSKDDLSEMDPGKVDVNDFVYLAYTQTMLLEIAIKDQKVALPHVTCNVVGRV